MSFLVANGRIGRLSYFLNSFIAFVVLHAAVAVLLLAELANWRETGGRPTLDTLIGDMMPLVLVMTLGVVSASWVLVISQVKRLHDLDRSGWVVLINLIPLVGLLLWVYLVMAKGVAGPTRYGPARPRTGTFSYA